MSPGREETSGWGEQHGSNPISHMLIVQGEDIDTWVSVLAQSPAGHVTLGHDYPRSQLGL